MNIPSHAGAIEVLRRIQWSANEPCYEGQGDSMCPDCERCEKESCYDLGGFHRPDCALAHEAGLETKTDDELRARQQEREKERLRKKAEDDAKKVSAQEEQRRAREIQERNRVLNALSPEDQARFLAAERQLGELGMKAVPQGAKNLIFIGRPA